MHVIYIDDEQPALDNFRLTVAPFLDIKSLNLFLDGKAALAWAKEHPVDVAFLDMEMSGSHGLNLARELKEIDRSIRIIFVTAFGQYALDAFGVDAIGYVMKPYMRSEIRKELDKAALVRGVQAKRVVIQTIPSFAVTINGKPFQLRREKAMEMLALLVERGEQGIATAEGISFLWPGRLNDSGTQSLFRMTYKRLADALEAVGVGDILVSLNNRRFLRTDQVDCDLYHILAGDEQAAKKYDGQFLREYSWAEVRNGQLHRMLLSKNFWE